MAGTLLCEDECRLNNMPCLVDVNTMGQVLSSLGVKIEKKVQHGISTVVI